MRRVAHPPVMILDKATTPINTRTEAIALTDMDPLMRVRTNHLDLVGDYGVDTSLNRVIMMS